MATVKPDRVKEFTFLEGLEGMVTALRCIPRSEGSHGGFLTRYAGEIEHLKSREADLRFSRDDAVRAHRMLATVATATADLSIQVAMASSNHAVCEHTCAARAAGDAQRARALHVACHVRT